METITYNLNSLQKKNNFYEDLSAFTTDILTNRKPVSLEDVRKYISFINISNKSVVRSFDEHYLEYLTMGVLLNLYTSHALSSGRLITSMLTFLYQNRNLVPILKSGVDSVRGALITLFLTQNHCQKSIDNAKQFNRFLKWLEATGEFSEETIRLKNWQLYIKTLSQDHQKTLFVNCKEIGLAFESGAKKALGFYTQNVEEFRKEFLPAYRFRENYIFCGRFEVEYHLNMVGAEILNRSLTDGYSKTAKKVILLPTCMSQPAGNKCKAILKGRRLDCTGCSPNCRINSIRKEYTSTNVEVALIPHSSGFSKFLEHWKNQDQTGLIGVACVLNLLKGGYEMQKLDIPSQCVFLDYCGCKKHWHKDGLPTSLNREQLRKVVG